MKIRRQGDENPTSHWVQLAAVAVTVSAGAGALRRYLPLLLLLPRWKWAFLTGPCLPHPGPAVRHRGSISVPTKRARARRVGRRSAASRSRGLQAAAAAQGGRQHLGGL